MLKHWDSFVPRGNILCSGRATFDFESKSNGRCHVRHYGITEAIQILLSYVDSTDTVAVIFESTLAVIVSVVRLLSVSIFRASL